MGDTHLMRPALLMPPASVVKVQTQIKSSTHILARLEVVAARQVRKNIQHLFESGLSPSHSNDRKCVGIARRTQCCCHRKSVTRPAAHLVSTGKHTRSQAVTTVLISIQFPSTATACMCSAVIILLSLRLCQRGSADVCDQSRKHTPSLRMTGLANDCQPREEINSLWAKVARVRTFSAGSLTSGCCCMLRCGGRRIIQPNGHAIQKQRRAMQLQRL